MSKYILLTGGTGFVGSHLLEKLLSLDKKVILLKRSFSNAWRIDDFIENKNLIMKNTDEENLDDIFSQYEIEGIFHLASISKRETDLNTIAEMTKTNITFPTQLLEAAANNDVEFFINTGTVYEYELDNPPISENAKIKPLNLYAATKIAFEDILKFYSKEYRLKCSTLKLFTPYGPKDNENKVTPYLITSSLKKEKIHIKSPNKTLDLIYIDDVVDAYIKIMDNISKLDSCTSFNIGTGHGTRIKDLLKIIESYTGNNDDVSFGNQEDEKVWCANNKVKEELNWTVKTNVKKGMKKTINYYSNHL